VEAELVKRSNLDSSLEKWLEAGLINQDQWERIRAFEGLGVSSRSTRTQYALGLLAAFSIGLGMISVIAANWELIPAGIKLAVYFVLFAILAFGMWRLEGESSILGEAVPVAYLLYILAGIGLIGQIYHLRSDGWQGLVMWSALGLFPTLRVNRQPTTFFWLLSYLGAFLAYIFSGHQGTGQRLDIFFLSWSILGLFSFEASPFRLPATLRPWCSLLSMGLTSIVFPFFAFDWDKSHSSLHHKIGLLMILISWVWLPWCWRALTIAQRGLVALGLVGFTVRTAIIARFSWNLENWWQLAEAIAFLVQLTAMAILALQYDEERWFRTLCALMFLRVAALFLTLFGSLLLSGTGLIALGVGLLLLVRLWQKHHGDLETWLKRVGR
jgi:uncharacterized membrane protein